MKKYSYKTDIAVLLIFFCRDDTFSQVFARVKKARPSKLYFYQDGPRNEEDLIGIKKCRKIADDENIDWECEVHRKYQEQNIGCDPSEYIAITWMFENEDMGIVLEDDDVPSVSFIEFCKETLERYKDDDRIYMICGINRMGISEHLSADYSFSARGGGIWGWATWKRIIDTWDKDYSWLDNEEKVSKIKKYLQGKRYQSFMDSARAHRKEGVEYYETILGAASIFYSGVNIIPKVNMISNIGVTGSKTATHNNIDDIKLLSKRAQHLFFQDTYEIDFPLKHPEEFYIDEIYDKEFQKWNPSYLRNICDNIEYAVNIVRYKGISELLFKVKRKLFGK